MVGVRNIGGCELCGVVIQLLFFWLLIVGFTFSGPICLIVWACVGGGSVTHPAFIVAWPMFVLGFGNAIRLLRKRGCYGGCASAYEYFEGRGWICKQACSNPGCECNCCCLRVITV